MKVLKLGLTLAGGDRGGFGGGGDRDRSGRGLQDRYFHLVGLCVWHMLLQHYSHVLFLAHRLGRRDSVEDEVSGVGRRSVVSR